MGIHMWIESKGDWMETENLTSEEWEVDCFEEWVD